MHRSVVLLGINGACDYQLVHDPDADALELWVDDLLVATRTQSAREGLVHLANTDLEQARAVVMGSVNDESVEFVLVVDEKFVMVLGDDDTVIAGLEDPLEVVAFLADAVGGGY